jgi:hypothetical protein
MPTPDIPGWSDVPQREIVVEYWPGYRTAVSIPRDRPGPPEYALCRYVTKRDGTLQLVPVDWSGCVRLTVRLPSRLRLGCSYRTLYRLVAGGFILAYRPTPKLTLIDLASLWAFFNSTQTDGETSSHFWTTERRQDALETAGLRFPETAPENAGRRG